MARAFDPQRAGAEQSGGVEHGAKTSTVLALVHLAFYIAAPVEGGVRGWPSGSTTTIGMGIYGFGIAWLAAVTVLLGNIWTVKLIVAEDHRLVTHPVFKLVRHPKYFLAILPELIDYATAFGAWVTLVIGLVTYAVPLALRIRQDEAVMRDRFPEYGS